MIRRAVTPLGAALPSILGAATLRSTIGLGMEAAVREIGPGRMPDR